MIAGISRRSRSRSGFGLSELLVAMFLFTAAIALFVAFLDQLLKLGSTSADHLDRLVVTGRLARAVRADAHAARSARLTGTGQKATNDKESNQLELTLPDNRRVEYTVERDRVRRQLFEGQTLKQTEEYPLDRSAGSWSIVPGEGAALLINLRLDRRMSPKRNSASRPMAIEALIGLDHRMEQGGRP